MDNFWACTSSGIYHITSGKMYLDSINGFPLRVEHIYEGPNGFFWLSTFQGLIKWKPFSQQYKLYNQKDHFIDNEIHAAYPDSLGRLWLSTNSGIISFDTASLQVNNYNKIDGFKDSEFNYLAHTRGPDGRIYFGGINGITAFEPNNLPKSSNKLDVKEEIIIDRIEHLDYYGDRVLSFHRQDLDKPLVIRSNFIQSRIFFKLPYFKEKKLEFQWRILGQTSEWNAFNFQNGLVVPKIQKSASTLEIKVRDQVNPDNHYIYRFKIFHELKLYEKYWFRAMILFIILTLSYFLFKLRTNILKKRNLDLEHQVKIKTQQYREQYEIIQDQNIKLAEIQAAKNQLFNNLSHEFRTPLSIIMGETEMLKDRLLNKGISKENLIRIENQCNQLNGMIDDILDLSRLQMGFLKNNPEAVIWNDFLRRVCAMFDGFARRKQLDYQVKIIPLEPVCLMLDVKKVERSLVNLIGNAFKFTPDLGRILVRSILINEETLEIVVCDTGPGVSPENHKAIFEQNKKGIAAKNLQGAGYGIGLFFCKELSKVIDARLWVESEPGKGATFFLRIPVAKRTNEAMSEPMEVLEDNIGEVSEMQTFASINKKAKTDRVLVVEDHPVLLDFITTLLEDKYHISTAINGEMAWRLLQSDPSFDLIISDVMMPVMDGFTPLNKMRNTPRLQFIPFLMLTALSSKDDRLNALRLGVDRYITKPFTNEELLVSVNNLLKYQKVPNNTRLTTLKNDPAEEELIKSYKVKWMEELEDIVKKNLTDPAFKVSNLAAEMHVSERTLFNKMKLHIGIKPSDYIRNARLDLARKMLIGQQYATVKEVAFHSGFKNARHFTILYKNEYGKGPGEYLNRSLH